MDVGDLGSIPGLGRSPGEGNGNPLQYYCLENPMDRGAYQAPTAHGVAKSPTRLSHFTYVWMWELDCEENWAPKNWCFEQWCWRRLLRAPWTARRSNQSILKEISPEYSLEGLISFRMDWLDLLAVQGNLKSLVQHTVQKHQFFGAQLSLWSNFHIHTWRLGTP